MKIKNTNSNAIEDPKRPVTAAELITMMSLNTTQIFQALSSVLSQMIPDFKEEEFQRLLAVELMKSVVSKEGETFVKN